jgi:hypothetical protein
MSLHDENSIYSFIFFHMAVPICGATANLNAASTSPLYYQIMFHSGLLCDDISTACN